MALLRLDRLGIPRFHRQSRHGDWLAAEGLWPVLELEDSPWQARPPGGAETCSPVDPYAQPRQSTMGRSPHSRRTAQARHHYRRDQRHQVHGPAPPASVTDLENVPGQSSKNDGIGGFLGRANDPVPDPVCVSGAGPRAPAHPALCRHRTFHSGVDGAADARSLSVGHGAAVPAAGPRSDLWPGVREASEGDGHQTDVVSTAFSVATCLRRAGHRHDPPRMPGSLDRVQRTQPTPAPPGIRGLLSSEPRSLGVGKRYSGAATDPAAGEWTDRVDTGAGRAASSIPAARRVNPALQITPLSGTVSPIDGYPCLRLGHQRFGIRSPSRSFPTNGSRTPRETAEWGNLEVRTRHRK